MVSLNLAWDFFKASSKIEEGLWTERFQVKFYVVVQLPKDQAPLAHLLLHPRLSAIIS